MKITFVEAKELPDYVLRSWLRHHSIEDRFPDGFKLQLVYDDAEVMIGHREKRYVVITTHESHNRHRDMQVCMSLESALARYEEIARKLAVAMARQALGLD